MLVRPTGYISNSSVEGIASATGPCIIVFFLKS